MATKKQKREAGRLKHEKEMADVKASGLAAQKAHRMAMEEDRTLLAEVSREINERHRDTLNRIATSEQKKQIEQEIGDVRLDHDPVMHGQVMYNRGMRI